MMLRPRILAAGALLALAVAPPAAAQTTFNVSDNNSISYIINASTNPTLNLNRGETYTFQVNAPGHPFWIKTVQSLGTVNAYNSGVTNNGDDVGTITFTVPMNAPSTLFYNCQFHGTMTGQINVMGTTPSRPDTWGKLKRRYL
jgi:hypothetical protein